MTDDAGEAAGDAQPFPPTNTPLDPYANAHDSAAAAAGSPPLFDESTARVVRAVSLGIALGIFLLRSARRRQTAGRPRGAGRGRLTNGV